MVKKGLDRLDAAVNVPLWIACALVGLALDEVKARRLRLP
jgi:hypothetical protein